MAKLLVLSELWENYVSLHTDFIAQAHICTKFYNFAVTIFKD